MKLLLLIISLLTLSNFCFSQEGTDTTQVTAEDTTSIAEDTTKTTEVDPVKQQILDIIKQVNERSASIDNIRSEGDIKIKTAKIDESGSILIQVKKKDDVYFKIEGPLGIDAAEGHFNRKKFTFLDHLNDQAVTGSSTILNIGSLTKIRCTFDDLVNAFSGTVRIPKSKKDKMTLSDEGGTYIIELKGEKATITRKYVIDKTSYSVYKYSYISKTGTVLIQFEFSSFRTSGDGSYAKQVEIRRPKQGEYFKLTFDNVNLNQSNLFFNVSIPSDYQRKVWK